MLLRSDMRFIKETVNRQFDELDDKVKNDPIALKDWMFSTIFRTISDIQENTCVPSSQADADRQMFLDGYEVDEHRPLSYPLPVNP